MSRIRGKLVIGGVSGLRLDGETAMTGIPVRNISCHLGTSFSVEYIGSSLTAPSFYFDSGWHGEGIERMTDNITTSASLQPE